MYGFTEFKNGSEEAFSKLYRRFQRPVLKYVRSKIRDDEVAMEVTQEVFLKVFRFKDRYQEGYAFSTWLWTIARNAVTDHLRSEGSQVHHGQNEDLPPDEIPSPHKNAEALILKKDQRRTFLKKARSLTRLQKRVLWMRVIRQLSYEEISRKLGLSLSAVKNLAYRGRMTLGEFSLI
jgi:RNA polymerase sigma-70 factor (ECF subfamily)